MNAASAYTITITDYEGDGSACGDYGTFEAANAALLPLAKKEHPSGGYCKVWLTVTHKLTGDTYKARYDVYHPSRYGNPDIAEHIRFASVSAATTCRDFTIACHPDATPDELAEIFESYGAWAYRMGHDHSTAA